MDKIQPPEISPSNILDILHTMREDMKRQEELPEQIIDSMRTMREGLKRQEELLEQITEFLRPQIQNYFLPVPAWLPSDVEKGVINNQPLPKVRKIEKLDGTSGTSADIDAVSRLKATWAGSLYTNHLKQYAFIRWIAIRIWRHGYPLYVNSTHLLDRSVKNRSAKRWRTLTRLFDYSNTKGMPTYKLADTAFVETPQPRVHPASEQTHLVSPHEGFMFPEIYVAKISNGMVYGGTNLILAGNEVICHDLYDFERDYTSEELHGRTLIKPKSRGIRWLLHDDTPESIPLAATFVDACAPNYAHWLTEVLPRVALFCSDAQFNDVPIIVNDGLHQNIMESLALMAGSEREIITIPIGRALVADTLYLTSVTGYVPFEWRNNKLPGHSHGIFSPKAFDVCREKIRSFTEKLPDATGPDKIFLRRNSGARKVLNAPEIERYFLSIGYAFVEPEKLTFLQQVMVFKNAKIIVGSSGAALANLLFAPIDAKIYIFIPKYKDTSYWYWQNIACATGKKVEYVFGRPVQDGIHSDFIVDINMLLNVF